MRVFISHSSSDNLLATKIYQRLRDHNVSVWFDKIEIRVGDSLLDKIADGIERSDYLLILITEHSNQSRWVREEVDIARTKEINDGGPKVIPIVVGEADVPWKLVSKLYFKIDEVGNGIDNIIPAIFRNSFVLDCELSPETLEPDKDLLRENLYEFTRRQQPRIILRIDNHDFTQQVVDVISDTLKDPELPEPVSNQIRRTSQMNQIVLPLFWRNFSALMSNLLEVIFDDYGKNLDAVNVAHQTAIRCFDYAQRILTKKLEPMVFAKYAKTSGRDGLAAYIKKFDQNEVKRDKDALYRICDVPKQYDLVRCDLEENTNEEIIFQKIILPIKKGMDKTQLRGGMPVDFIITKHSWYTWCVPQIIERALIWTSFREGKPLHELPYKIGLRMSDYPAIGLS